MIERLKDNKSLVDIRLTTGIRREFFQNHVDSPSFLCPAIPTTGA